MYEVVSYVTLLFVFLSVVHPVLNGPSTSEQYWDTGDNVGLLLPCNITGDPVTYSWTIRGSPIDDNDYRFDVDSFTGLLNVSGEIVFSDDGEYVCTGSNEASSISVTHTVHVQG